MTPKTAEIIKQEIAEGVEKLALTEPNPNSAVFNLPQLKGFISHISHLAEQEMLKACGGCKHCYGKGYGTSIEYLVSKYATVKLPEIRFCSCERGKELKKRFEEAHQQGREEERERLRKRLLPKSWDESMPCSKVFSEIDAALLSPPQEKGQKV